jgi:hypothetical protein
VTAKPRDGDTTCPAQNRRLPPFNNLQVRNPDPNAPAGSTLRAWTPTPVISASSTNRGGYVVAADFRTLRPNVAGGTRLLVWRVVGTRERPRLRGIVGREIGQVGEFLTPPSVPQGGADRRPLDTLDTRTWQAIGVTHADTGRYRIWTSHTIAAPQTQPESPRRTAVRWYEFQPPPPAGGAPIQFGTADSAQVDGAPADMNLFNGAVSPDRTGRNAVLHYNISNATTPVQIHARSRRSTDPAGNMVGSQLSLRESLGRNGEYVTLPAGCVTRTFTDGTQVCRWGDYVSAVPDPSNDGVVWGTNMWIGPDGEYRTWNFALQPVAAP